MEMICSKARTETCIANNCYHIIPHKKTKTCKWDKCDETTKCIPYVLLEFISKEEMKL